MQVGQCAQIGVKRTCLVRALDVFCRNVLTFRVNDQLTILFTAVTAERNRRNDVVSFDFDFGVAKHQFLKCSIVVQSGDFGR